MLLLGLIIHRCRLVVSTLEGMDKGRKCFRMIGGVLVERTVGEVLPAVKDNHKWVSSVVRFSSSYLTVATAH